MRVCYFGTYDESFPRNDVIIQGLIANGVQVIRCQSKLWSGTLDKISGVATLGRRPLSIARRAASSYYRLWRAHASIRAYDVMVVGYAGHFDMLLAAVLARSRRKPLVFDAFLSLYGAAVEDRRVVGPTSVSARTLRAIDRVSCTLADVVLMDTQSHIDWYAREYCLARERFRRVLMGANALEPVEVNRNGNAPGFKVIYFGQFIPLHGVEHILGAARALQGYPDIKFELVGDGQTWESAALQARGLSNVDFIRGWFRDTELAERVNSADLCLGVFGDGRKAGMVIPQKVAFALALGKPVLTMDSAAVREIFRPGHDIFVCQGGNPESLASSILALRNDPSLREGIALQGHRLFQEKFSSLAVGKSVKDILTVLCEA